MDLSICVSDCMHLEEQAFFLLLFSLSLSIKFFLFFCCVIKNKLKKKLQQLVTKLERVLPACLSYFYLYSYNGSPLDGNDVWLVSRPLCATLIYLNNSLMYCHKTASWHSGSPQVETCLLLRSSSRLCNATMKVSLYFVYEELQQ